MSESYTGWQQTGLSYGSYISKLRDQTIYSSQRIIFRKGSGCYWKINDGKYSPFSEMRELLGMPNIFLFNDMG